MSTTIEERYGAAAHTGSLKIGEHGRSGAVEVLMAAGMSPQRLGAALIRLHSEYDGSGFRRGVGGAVDLMLLRGQLRSLDSVIRAATDWAERSGIENAAKVVPAALSWWINNACHACAGHGKQKIKDSPALSNIRCRACNGTGQQKLLYGEAGRRVAAYLDDCKSRAAHSISKRLRG